MPTRSHPSQFGTLFDISPLPKATGGGNGTSRPKKSPSKKPKADERGCNFCPLNKVKGIQKIFGSVTGKNLALFAQSPGPQENEEGIELVGPAGQWFWDELKKVGLKREDFDIQNVIRCMPANLEEGSYNSYLQMRNPTAQEIKCCSLHTDNVLPKLKAKRILILGQVAAKALLGVRTLPTSKIFYNEKLGAKCYLVDHPAYFLRGGSEDRLRSFRQTLVLFAQDRDKPSDTISDRYACLKKLDLRLVLDEKQALEAKTIIEKYAQKGRRIVVDIEDAPINGERWVVACGFCPRPGLAFTFVFCHRDQLAKAGESVQQVAKSILENPKIKFAMHYGVSDVIKLRELCDITVPYQSFDHDTMYSEYLRFSDKKKYGLDAVIESRFPEFAGYKTIVTGDMLKNVDNVPEKIRQASPDVQYAYIEKNKLFDVSKLSLETLRLYNGGDCHCTKLIEVSNKNKVPQALLRLYIDLSFVLHQMEPQGPYFDYGQHGKLKKLYHAKEKSLKKWLQKAIGNPDYNPGSHQQVYKAVYETLDLEYPGRGKPNTQKFTMLMLGRENKFCKKQVEWRGVSKAESTYIDGYYVCAQLNNGQLITIWRGTGTRTGRLSSGGGRDDPHKVNLQNIHGDSQIQNLCVADTRWREFYLAARDLVTKYGDCPDRLEAWVRENMPDLKTFLTLDYGQIEVRVAALMTGDENLKADCQGSDIHTKVGVTMTHWPAEKIRNHKKTRTFTKNVHFGILFGSEEEGVYWFVFTHTDPEEQEAISREELHQAYTRYFKRYPKVLAFRTTQREFGREHKYVETLFGMRQPLYIREGDEDSYGAGDEESGGGAYWGNQAINGPIQGTAHQLLICGLVNLYRQPEKYKLLQGICLDVHDALDFIVEVLQMKPAYEKAKYLMEHESLETVKKDFPEIQWDVPIIVEGEAGISLGCRIELKDDFTVGQYLLDWYKKRREQVIALNQELEQIKKPVS